MFKVGDKVEFHPAEPNAYNAPPGTTGVVGSGSYGYGYIDVIWDRSEGGHTQMNGGYRPSDFKLIEEKAQYAIICEGALFPGPYSDKAEVERKAEEWASRYGKTYTVVKLVSSFSSTVTVTKTSL